MAWGLGSNVFTIRTTFIGRRSDVGPNAGFRVLTVKATGTSHRPTAPRLDGCSLIPPPGSLEIPEKRLRQENNSLERRNRP